MRHTIKVVLALMLAFMLVFAAFAEETGETAAAAAVSASGITVTVEEQEYVPAVDSQKVYIVLQNDSKDSVLSDSAKSGELWNTVALICDVLEGTGSEVYVVLAAPKADEVVVQQLDIEDPEADKAVIFERIAAQQYSDKLDSSMWNTMPDLVENADNNTWFIIIGDGVFTGGNKYADKSVADVVAANGAHVMYRSVEMGYNEAGQDTAAQNSLLMTAYFGEGTDCRNVSVNELSLSLANDLFAAIGMDVTVARTAYPGLVKAVSYCYINEYGNYVYTSAEDVYAVGRVLDLEITVGFEGNAVRTGEALSVTLPEEHQGLVYSFELNGSVVTADENGVISADQLPAGEHSLVVKAYNEETGIELVSEPAAFTVADAPVAAQDAETTYVRYVKLDGVSDDGTLELRAASVGKDFGEGNFSFTAEAAEGSAYSVNMKAAIPVIEGLPSEGTRQVKFTVYAEDKDTGLTGSCEYELTVIYMPGIIEDIAEQKLLVCYDEPATPYEAGETISMKFVLEDEEMKNILAEGIENGWDIRALYTMGGDPVEMEGSIEEGWLFEAAAVDGVTDISVYLTCDGDIEGKTPAWDFSEVVVYTDDELVENIIGTVHLGYEWLENEYAINDEVVFRVYVENADSKLLPGAFDFGEYSIDLVLDGDLIKKTAEGYTINDVPFSVEGDLENGWIITMPAHCETVVNGKLVAVRAGQEDIYGNDHPFDIHVQPADFMTRMACIVDGKEPWENPSMTKLYIAMGGIVVLIAAVVIFIINLTRKRFKGVLTIEVTAGADKTYQSKPIDLSVWGKKAVNFGILLSGSGLPPIAELTRADVMNKLSFKPVKEGIRVTNKTDMFGTGAKAVVLAAGKSHRLATADSGFAMKLTYKLNAGDKAEE